jgi:hypothetical protein
MSAKTFVHKITAKRETHQQRNVIIRATYVLLGFLLLIPGVPLLILFPEAGIPLSLVGLALLSLEYNWAGSTLLWFAKIVDKSVAWYRRLKRPVRYGIE